MRPLNLALSILHNRLGSVPRPSWCTYLVTYRCNARCTMCDSWRIKPGDELTAPQIEQVFAKIGRLDVVRLTGGEPFLRGDMPEIAEAVLRQSRPGVIHITTNGSFPQRVADLVRGFSRPRLLRFMVSFDGLKSEHDKNRGEDVLFDTAVETCRQLGELRRTHGVEVSANHTVINPHSMTDNDGLRAALSPLGVEVHSVIAYADSAMYGAKRRGKKAEDLILGESYPVHPALNGADVAGFVERELERVGEYGSAMLRWGKRYYLRGLKTRLNGKRPVSPRPPCVALRSHVRLLPDGSVPVCQFNTERVGNLLHMSFDELWRAETTRASRRWVDACPGCWAECEVMPSAIYSGDILRG
ncbi:Cyclic pyranopterin monophosphate synthase [Phycisphaerae bacterium RAS1]|nr:Cyclic pyranopterin monophosphate synthase [Phycisphaerae bacterium RAS1]